MRSENFLCWVVLSSLVGFARDGVTEEDAGGPAAKIEQLEEHDRRRIEEFRKSLPAGYRAEPVIRTNWSDDEHRMVAFLVALTPMAPDGQPDGEAQFYAGHYLSHVVPYQKGQKHGVERKFDYVTDGQGTHKVTVAEIPWVNGKIHGVKRLSYENGKPRLEAPYVNGAPHGESREYELSGRLVKVTPYQHGKRHGEMTEYWTTTEKPMRIVPYKDDRVDGTVREFYDSGQLRKEVPARSGRFHGIEKQYDEEGALTKKRYWLDDQEVPESEFLQKVK